MYLYTHTPMHTRARAHTHTHTASMLSIGLLPGRWVAFMAIVLQSFATSINLNTGNCAFAQFFGRKHLGEIQSYAHAAVVAGSAFGPYPFGYIADVTGSFLPAFRYLATLPLLGAVLVLRYGKNPTRQAVSSSSTRGIEGDRSRDLLYDVQGAPGDNGVQVEMLTTEAGLLDGEDRNTTDASADQGRSAVVISALHT